MKEVFYNVWMPYYNRWTNARHSFYDTKQDPKNPIPLTLLEAEDFRKYIGFGEVRPLIGYKPRKPKKPMPEFQLDNTLPVLQAGYLQDRQRKQFKR